MGAVKPIIYNHFQDWMTGNGNVFGQDGNGEGSSPSFHNGDPPGNGAGCGMYSTQYPATYRGDGLSLRLLRRYMC